MSKISISIIGYNEAPFLEKCLESIKWADEIIYVDCESSDDSIKIAERYSVKVFKRKNNFNINVNKQFGIKKCSSDWILYLDPDEWVDEDFKNEILEIVSSETKFNGFLIPRKNFYFGKWLKYGGKYPDRQLRFFRNGKGRFPCIDIHERISIEGSIGILKNHIYHNVIDNTDWLLAKVKSYSLRKNEQSYRLNKPVKGFFFKGIKRFILNYFLRLGFLDGRVGFIVAFIDFLNTIICWLKYRETRINHNFIDVKEL